MSHLEDGDLRDLISELSQENSKPITPSLLSGLRNPVTPLPPSLRASDECRVDDLDTCPSFPQVHTPIQRTGQQQRELRNRVSGKGEPFEASTEPIPVLKQKPRHTRCMNDKDLSARNFLACAIMDYWHAQKELPGCLYVSSKLQQGLREDKDIEEITESFAVFGPFPTILVLFFNKIPENTVICSNEQYFNI